MLRVLHSCSWWASGGREVGGESICYFSYILSLALALLVLFFPCGLIGIHVCILPVVLQYIHE